jgi:hypothetical protein
VIHVCGGTVGNSVTFESGYPDHEAAVPQSYQEIGPNDSHASSCVASQSQRLVLSAVTLPTSRSSAVTFA